MESHSPTGTIASRQVDSNHRKASATRTPSRSATLLSQIKPSSIGTSQACRTLRSRGIGANLVAETVTFRATVACFGNFSVVASTTFRATLLVAVATAQDGPSRATMKGNNDVTVAEV
ncbi:hypothetical protein FRB93_007311 [Tulasnella sp. JGI-2019a]|nr:hypothetical protein FRB93_007311 [Tulasnella sp. JGI-2019a]